MQEAYSVTDLEKRIDDFYEHMEKKQTNDNDLNMITSEFVKTMNNKNISVSEIDSNIFNSVKSVIRYLVNKSIIDEDKILKIIEKKGFDKKSSVKLLNKCLYQPYNYKLLIIDIFIICGFLFPIVEIGINIISGYNLLDNSWGYFAGIFISVILIILRTKMLKKYL
jgi:hypothetical protein